MPNHIIKSGNNAVIGKNLNEFENGVIIVSTLENNPEKIPKGTLTKIANNVANVILVNEANSPSIIILFSNNETNDFIISKGFGQNMGLKMSGL